MLKQKKINILHTESSCGWGGQELRILTESTGMIARGHQVRIICPKESIIYEQAKRRNIATTALPISRKNIKGLFNLYLWLKRNPVDIINTHSSTDSWLSAIANFFLKQKYIIVRTRHISAPLSKNVATTWLYTKASSFIVTTGKRLKTTLIKENNYPENIITSIPTGMDPRIFFPKEKQLARDETGIKKDVFTIGIVATIRSWKGHIYLIEALHKLNNLNLHIIIIGDGPARPTLEKHIQKYDLEKQVNLVGNKDNVVPWLQSLDLFVLPSYANEGVPQGLMQAMLCCIPVISTPVGSTDELVLHEKTGLLVNPKDSSHLSEAIKRMIENDNFRNTLAIQGREHVLENYTFKHMLDGMEDVFYSCLEK